MSEYNHSAFLGSKSTHDYLAAMSPDDRRALNSYLSEQLAPTPEDLPDDEPRVQFPYANNYMTASGIFVALRSARSMSMKPTPDNYHIDTCRPVGDQMLQETLEVQMVNDVFRKDRVDRIIGAKGIITSQLVVIELAKSASWIEIDDTGWERSIPLRPFRLLPSQLEGVSREEA